MDKKRRRGVIALLLVLSIGNFLRIAGHETLRPILLLTVLAIGALSGILISDLARFFRSRKEDKDKMM